MVMQKIDNALIPLKQESSTTGVTVVLSLATLITSLAISSVNIILPELVSSLNTTFSHVQWMIIAYMLSLTSTLVVAGQLSDMFGRKRLFLMGLVIFSTSAGLSGLIQNLWMLVGMRVFQGIGGAILIAVTMAIISDIFPKNRIASAMGLIGSMSAIGTGLGPVVSGLLVDSFNWQIIFLLNIPIGILIYVLAKKHLPCDSQVKKKYPIIVDYKGIFLLSSAILACTLCIKLTRNGFDITNLVLCLLSVLFLLAFISVERNSLYPLIKLSMFKDRGLTLSLINNFIVSIVVMSSLVIGPFYLTIAFDLNTTQAGIAMAASPITVAITSFFIGRISKLFDLRKIILIGHFILTLAAVCMTLLNVTYGLMVYLLCLITMGVGYATFLSTNNTLTMINALPQTRGSRSGILNLSRNLGLLTGASIMSTIFASASDITDIATANTYKVEAGLHAVYQLAIVFLIAAIIVQIIAIRTNNKVLVEHIHT